MTLTVGAKTIKLDGDRDILISSSKNEKADIKINDSSLDGMNLRIVFKHGSIFMIADSVNFIETYKSPSAYYKLYPEEKVVLQPGDIIKMGAIKFAVERFNTCVVADIGIRGSMEDTFVISQDLQLEECMKFSLFAVIDGHGGDWCAHFIRKRLENEIRN